MLKIRKVAVAVSGGVDSAVAALILKQKGYEVQGVFMQNWDMGDETGYCQANQDFHDASLVCDRLNIKLRKVNFVKEYWNEVFCNLLQEYESGCTPNPDILCNKYIKFSRFAEYARDQMNVDAIATGHYARSSFGCFLENYQRNQLVRLLTACDRIKDQTLFLCQIRQEVLQRTMFPLGDLKKQTVKRIARENHLTEIANKKESMGICFIGKRNFPEFISEYVDNRPGVFVDIDTGKTVGRHSGVHHWTLGQRARITGFKDALYIARKDVASGTIYVAKGTHHPALFGNLFYTDAPYWIHSAPEELSHGVFRCDFRFQHNQRCSPCEMHVANRGCVVVLDKDSRALTPGQYAIFYRGEECLGGARISQLGPSRHIMQLRQGDVDQNAFAQMEVDEEYRKAVGAI